MGIKRGFATIEEYYTPESINLKDLKEEYIVIDTQGLLHRMIRENINNKHEFLLQMINFLEKFERFKIRPIFVFDGKTNLVKSPKNINMRKKAESHLNILLDFTKEQEINTTERETNTEIIDKISTLKKKSLNIPIWIINECKDLFDSLDCIYIHSYDYEGDQIMSQIIKSNLIKYVYSEDFDMLLFDIPYVLKSLDYNNDKFKLYNKVKLLEALELSSEQLIDVAILTGTDFNCGLYKSTFKSNLEIIKQYETIDNFKSNLETINLNRKEGFKILLPTYNFDYNLVTKYFTLKNIDYTTILLIKSKIGSYLDKKSKYNNETENNSKVVNETNVTNVNKYFEKIKTINLSSYSTYKYTLKLSNYCKEHFGIVITI